MERNDHINNNNNNLDHEETLGLKEEEEEDKEDMKGEKESEETLLAQTAIHTEQGIMGSMIDNYAPKNSKGKKKVILKAVGKWAGVEVDGKKEGEIVTLVETKRQDEGGKEEKKSFTLSIFGPTMNNMREFLEQITLGIRSTTQSIKLEESKIDLDAEAIESLEVYNPKRKLKFPVVEYAPHIFRSLREKYFNIPEEEYLNEWSLNEEDLKAKEGAGRSGALFCFSRTRRFILKTIFKSEVVTLTSLLQKFYSYIVENPDTLIMRLLGLFPMKLFKSQHPTSILENNNIFQSFIKY
jgi:hypothetical protein